MKGVNPKVGMIFCVKTFRLVAVDVLSGGKQSYGYPAQSVRRDKVFGNVVADIDEAACLVGIFVLKMAEAFAVGLFRRAGFRDEDVVKQGRQTQGFQLQALGQASAVGNQRACGEGRGQFGQEIRRSIRSQRRAVQPVLSQKNLFFRFIKTTVAAQFVQPIFAVGVDVAP